VYVTIRPTGEGIKQEWEIKNKLNLGGRWRICQGSLTLQSCLWGWNVPGCLKKCFWPGTPPVEGVQLYAQPAHIIFINILYYVMYCTTCWGVYWNEPLHLSDMWHQVNLFWRTVSSSCLEISDADDFFKASLYVSVTLISTAQTSPQVIITWCWIWWMMNRVTNSLVPKSDA
jgi:hypothetical protein